LPSHLEPPSSTRTVIAASTGAFKALDLVENALVFEEVSGLLAGDLRRTAGLPGSFGAGISCSRPAAASNASCRQTPL
jgi:hypothetical protein